MEPRETSGITVQAILRYVRERDGEQAVREVLRRAGRSGDAYLDKRRWWSYETKISLFAALHVHDRQAAVPEPRAVDLHEAAVVRPAVGEALEHPLELAGVRAAVLGDDPAHVAR